MAFCVKCGTQIVEGAKFCSGCGAPIVSAGVPSNQNTLMADEKYCFSCGSVIKKAAIICPKCGVNQSNRSGIEATDVYCASCGKKIRKEADACPYCGVPQANTSSKSKVVAIILGIFLGGAHRIYTGKIGTGIPMILLYVFGLSIWYIGIATLEDSFYIGGIIILIGWAIWLLVDIIRIITGAFTDNRGRPLK